MNWNDFDAVLFDLDGVLTPTAKVHMRAWQHMLSDFLDSQGVAEQYREQDYFDYIDGKPRYDGVRSFLAARDIELPEGRPDDPETALTVCGLGNRKDALFGEVLRADGVRPYPGSVQLLDFLTGRDIRLAVVSSSRNALDVLKAAGLATRFSTVVDGAVAADAGLAGKPAPDTFEYAAEQFGVPKERAVVFEDAVSGVQAGRAGHFGLVVGVDREAGRERLLSSGADIVVEDLNELVG